MAKKSILFAGIILVVLSIAWGGWGNAVKRLLPNAVIGNGSGTVSIYDKIEIRSSFILKSDTARIAGNALATLPDAPVIELKTEGDVTLDTLESLPNGTDFQVIILKTKSSSKDVTVLEGTGNIVLTASPRALNNSRDALILMFYPLTNQWLELSYANNQ